MQAASTTTSYVASLLATENLSVFVGDFSTASFDTVNRTLQLPSWNVNPATNDMLIAHEVAHALWSPVEWKVSGINSSLINIFEDIRIERLIQDKYPGLAGIWKRGYIGLYEQSPHIKSEWFERDCESAPIDRINIYAKFNCTGLVEYDLTPHEREFYEAALAAESFDDIIEICRKWMNSDVRLKLDDLPESPQSDSECDIDTQDSTEGSNSECDLTEDDCELVGDGDGDGESSLPSPDSPCDTPTINENDDTQEGPGVTGQQPTDDALDEPDTTPESDSHETVVAIQRTVDDSVNESGNDHTVTFNILPPDISVYYDTIIDVDESWLSAPDDYGRSFDAHFSPSTEREIKAEGNRFISEFRRKQAATKYRRRQVSKSGKISPEKLANYRFTEDIFKSITKVDEGQSHGFFMMIDVSVSVSHRMLAEQFRQAAIMVRVAQTINAPFEVITYTGKPRHKVKKGYMSDFYIGAKRVKRGEFPAVKPLDTNSLNRLSSDDLDLDIVRYVSSDWNRSAIEYGFSVMCAIASGGVLISQGCTPTASSLLLISPRVDEIKRSRNIEKMHIIHFTDGEGNPHFMSPRKVGATSEEYPGVEKICTLNFRGFRITTQVGTRIDDNLYAAYDDSGIYVNNVFFAGGDYLTGIVYATSKFRANMPNVDEAAVTAAACSAFVSNRIITSKKADGCDVNLRLIQILRKTAESKSDRKSRERAQDFLSKSKNHKTKSAIKAAAKVVAGELSSRRGKSAITGILAEALA